jgi:hypothetical protein
LKTVTAICKDCGVHFKISKGDSRFRPLRRERRISEKMPMGHCPKCVDKSFMRRDENFRAYGHVAREAKENSLSRQNFNRGVRVRPWAWRELDD